MSSTTISNASITNSKPVSTSFSNASLSSCAAGSVAYTHAAYKGSLNIFYQNVRGLRTKYKQFFGNVLDSSFDIIAVTETWLQSSNFSEEYFDSNEFNVYRKDRSATTSNKSIGGGVLVAIKKIFNSEIIDSDNSIEQVWIKLDLNGVVFYICCLYIAPDVDDLIYKMHMDSISSILLKITTECVIILGDFNMSKITWSDFSESDSSMKKYLVPFNVKSNKESCIKRVIPSKLSYEF